MDKRKLTAVILITVLGFVCYFNSLSVPFIWDDTGLVSNNYLIKDFRHLGRVFSTDLFDGKSEARNFYRPFQAFSYMLDYQVWKLRPVGYHLTNIILHILAACFLYKFILIISADTVISLITALLFVSHPIHVEAVTYISGRADMLVALFLLLSLILFIECSYLFSLLSFGLALLSKELALIFPFLLLLYTYGFNLPLAKAKVAPKVVYLSFFLLSGAYIALRFVILPNKAIFSSLGDNYINALFFLKAIFLYLKTLLLPFGLHMSYAVRLASSIWDASVWASIVGVICLIFLALKAYRKFKLFSFGLAWFGLFLLPHSGILSINAYFAEHFCYVASMGVFFALAIIAAWLIVKKKIFILLPAGLIIFYAYLSVQYNFVWHSPERFYKHILKFSRGSYNVYNNLAAIKEKEGNYKEAEKYYLKALDIRPDFDTALLNLIRVIYLSGRKEAAFGQLKSFLDERPSSFWGWANLGSMYANNGQFSEAITAYKESLRINSAIPNHHYFLGLIYEEAGDLSLAIETLRAAAVLDNKNPAYHSELAAAYKKVGLYELALKEYLYAFNLEPGNAEASLNLGIAYALLQKFEQAEHYFLNSLKLDSSSAIAHYNLGAFYWQKGDYARAKEEFDKALAIDPAFSEVKIWRDKLSDSP